MGSCAGAGAGGPDSRASEQADQGGGMVGQGRRPAGGSPADLGVRPTKEPSRAPGGGVEEKRVAPRKLSKVQSLTCQNMTMARFAEQLQNWMPPGSRAPYPRGAYAFS